mmetsp:Transcript_18265/g.27376  ORF Transcript_18265/g.27376 Transcript_18265/m.27376 type:complete len:130 (+) Transcript_18265:3-392(+)
MHAFTTELPQMAALGRLATLARRTCNNVKCLRMMSTAKIETKWLLIYDYVEDVLEKRKPHREGHLDLIKSLMEDGSVIMAGALANPPDKAYFVLDSKENAEKFAKVDPYVLNGVVTSTEIREWSSVKFE